MTKFIEVMIDGKTHAINIDNIAMAKQIDANTLELHLLSKDKTGQISFKVPMNYGKLKYILVEEGRLDSDLPFIATN